MRHASLFSGIGGFDLASEWMGWENVLHCEWNEFGQKVLKYYWPNAISYGDITKTDFTKHRGEIDILTGGFPCQPYSQAGKRLGKEDERHLWPEMLRAIREIRPRWVVGENVRGLLSWNGGMVFDEVQSDLEAAGYEVLPFLLPACAVNAPHKRERIWFVAHALSAGTRSDGGTVGDEGGRTREDWRESIRQAYREISAGGTDSTGADGFSANPCYNGLHESENGQGNRTRDDGNAPRQNAVIQSSGCSDQTARKDISSDSADTGLESMQSGGEDWFYGFETVTNTTNFGLQSTGETRERGTGLANDNFRSDAPDSNSGERCEGRVYPPRPEEAERHAGTCDARSYGRPNWENFPTQPPVCSRDDGLSPELAGITFSKHRNESLKGYGNAVVPQVVYQIFQAIEWYEFVNS